MTSSEHLAQRQLDAYNAHDLHRFAECYSENVQLFRLQSGDVFCDGKKQLVEIYSKLFTSHTSLDCKLINRIVCGEIAIDEEEVSGLIPNAILHAVADDSSGMQPGSWSGTHHDTAAIVTEPAGGGAKSTLGGTLYCLPTVTFSTVR